LTCTTQKYQYFTTDQKPRQNGPFLSEYLDPNLIHSCSGHTSLHLKQHLNQFTNFYTVHPRDQTQTDRQTDRPCCIKTNEAQGRMHRMQRSKRRMKHKAACIECSVVIAVDERQTLVVKLSTDFRRYHSKVGRRLVSQRGATAADYQTTSLAVDSLPSHEGQTYHRCHRTYEERHRGTATTRYAHTHTHTHTHTVQLQFHTNFLLFTQFNKLMSHVTVSGERRSFTASLLRHNPCNCIFIIFIILCNYAISQSQQD